jgi:polyferredoxin/formate hydrogenlyase subunit 6/NADH:ubiquinone oxidoreductase subunit I
MRARTWRRARQAVQVLAFLLYVALLVYASAQRPTRLWTDLFTRLDPLLMLAASMAGRVLLWGLLPAAGILLLTLLFGRAWCGWLCPLGSLLEWLGPRRARRKAPPDAWRRIKFLLLLAILVAALLGSQALGFLDPITILNRGMATALWPALHYAVSQVEAFLYRFGVLWPALDALHQGLVAPLFLGVRPVFALAPLSALVLAALIALNWWAPRFWCRYLCPLGGLLGLLSRPALVRREVRGACIECGRCGRECPTGTVNPRDGFRSDPAECTVCFDCLQGCAEGSAGFRWHLPAWRPAGSREYDPTRRQLVLTAATTVAGVALLGTEPITKRRPATLIWPPGADAAQLGARCSRCAACVRACPTQGLQPCLVEGGLQNLMAPRLVPRLGFCDYGCTACGQVCPTGAIPHLALEEKRQTRIGLASVNRNRCLPWAYGVPCIICEESCPVPDKAIQLEEVEVRNSRGETVLLQRPTVVQSLCIGCGVCEFKCPMGGEAAIRVYAPTEAGL